MTYDLTVLNGASMLDFFLIANYWTDGILFTAITIMTALIVFAIGKFSQQPTTNVFISSTFAGFFIALFFWLLPFQGQPSISEYIPVLFAVLLGVSIFMKVRQ